MLIFVWNLSHVQWGFWTTLVETRCIFMQNACVLLKGTSSMMAFEHQYCSFSFVVNWSLGWNLHTFWEGQIMPYCWTFNINRKIDTWSFNFLLIVELNLFLIALSVLPGKYLAMTAHQFPSFSCRSTIKLSSLSVHLSLLISGFKWLCHLMNVKWNFYLSLHCFPILPGRAAAIVLQFLAPYFLTI
jgi:hypothetical protein